MSSTSKILLSIVGVLVVVIGLSVSWLIGARQAAGGFESQLKNEKEAIELVLGQYGQKVIEAAQVPQMHTENLLRLTREAMSRYGEDGSKAMFLSIREQNPNAPEALYVKVQQLVEAGRTDIEVQQKRMLAVRASYERFLLSPQGMVAGLMGYPKINFDDYKIITTGRAKQAAESGVESGPLNIMGAGKQ